MPILYLILAAVILVAVVVARTLAFRPRPQRWPEREEVSFDPVPWYTPAPAAK